MTVTLSTYKRGGVEVNVRLRGPDGRIRRIRRKSPVSSKSGSQRWGEAPERELLTRLILPAPPPDRPVAVPTLREFAPRFIDGYARANRHKASGIAGKEGVLRTHLLPQFGERRLDQIRDEDIQRLKSQLAAKAASTVNNALTCLSTMLRVALEWRVIAEMPCRIKLLKVVRGPGRFFDFDQYARLVAAAAKIDPRAHIMMLLGGDAGLRRGEMIALRYDDLDLALGITHVARSIWKGVEDYPKGAQSRPVNMTAALRAAIKAHRHLRSPRVLCTNDGTDVTAKTLRTWMAAAERRANLPPTGGVHKLRHTFFSHLAMRGAPAKAIQELAGHKSLSTTLQYMHLSPAARQSAIQLLDTRRTEAAEEGAACSVDTGTDSNHGPSRR